MTLRPRLLTSLIIVTLAVPSVSWAADATWNAATGAWATGANWTPASAPGTTSGTTNTDTATFNNNAAGSTAIITVDSYRNLQNIVINQSTATPNGGYAFNTGTLALTSGGSITYNNNVTSGTGTRLNVNTAPIVLGGAAGGTYSFISNRSGSNSGGLLINANAFVSSAATTGNTMTLTLGGNNTFVSNTAGSTVRTVISDGTAGGKVALTKEGSGTWMLFGNQTYTGATTVNAGTLIIYGSTASGSAVTVNSGAVFTGTGTVNGSTTLTAGSHLRAGIDTGTTATFNLNSLNTADDAIMDIEFGSNANDQFAISGQLSLAGTTDINLFAVGTTDPFAAAGTYTLMTAGSITGFGASSFNVANAQSGFTYAFNNTGNAITLNIQAIPEPSTWALLGLGAGLTGFRFIRRRRAA